MNLHETGQVLAVIQVGDNRRVDELTIQEWHHAIGDLRVEDAVAAVREHRRNSTEYLTARHVRAGVRRLRRARLDATPLPEPPAEVSADPRSFVAWVKATTKTIGDGTFVTPPAPELVARAGVLRVLSGAFHGVEDLTRAPHQPPHGRTSP